MMLLIQILIHSSFILFLLVFHHFFLVNKIIKIKGQKLSYDKFCSANNFYVAVYFFLSSDKLHLILVFQNKKKD